MNIFLYRTSLKYLLEKYLTSVPHLTTISRFIFDKISILIITIHAFAEYPVVFTPRKVRAKLVVAEVLRIKLMRCSTMIGLQK